MDKNNVKIVIAGVEGVNKGAELMLYAILQQIEKRYPDAIVYLPITQFPRGLNVINTSLKLKQNPNKFIRFWGKYHITGLLNRLGIRSKFLNNLYPVKNAKYYLDASGLYFSDQMIASERIAIDLQILLQGYSNQGTKIIYLPQAFGPFSKKGSLNAVKIALKYSDLVIARDDISLKYLLDLNEPGHIKQYYDFTGIVQGIQTSGYAHLKGKVCIIPNKQVIRKKILSVERYQQLLLSIIDTVYNNGYEVFFLDHADDISLIDDCIRLSPYDIPVVREMDARIVKGIIGLSYLCVSSRFHGVVSAFSCDVPCLTTSWNHKYQELLKLYDMEDSMISSSAIDCVEKIQLFLSKEYNDKIRLRLQATNKCISQNIQEMWNDVWNII